MTTAGESEAKHIIEAARKAVEIKTRVELVGPHESIPIAIGAGGNIEVHERLQRALREAQDDPDRRLGTAKLTELDSFLAHVGRQKEERSVIFASINASKITAIYNYDGEGSDPSNAGWGDYRAEYTCPLSPEWEAWRANDGKKMSQEDFAEWLDEREEDLHAIEGCKPIELMEMARNLRIHVKGTFAKKIDPTTGQYALECKEEHTKESTAIPRKFGAALCVFEGGKQYAVELRLQFRISDGKSWFSYTIHRANEIKRDAFREMLAVIRDSTELPVFAGVAPSAR